VHVVPARVHQAVLGGEGDARPLDDRKAVELGAGHDRGCTLADAHEQPGADDMLDRSAERIGDAGARLRLEMPELGPPVQQAS
jgi:hypothetical protein